MTPDETTPSPSKHQEDGYIARPNSPSNTPIFDTEDQDPYDQKDQISGRPNTPRYDESEKDDQTNGRPNTPEQSMCEPMLTLGQYLDLVAQRRQMVQELIAKNPEALRILDATMICTVTGNIFDRKTGETVPSKFTVEFK